MTTEQSPPTTLSEERLRLQKLKELHEEARKPTTNWLKEQIQESHFSQYARLNAEEIAVDLLRSAEQMARVQDENDRLKFSLKAADREYELLEEKVDRFEIALTEIASYDKEKRHGDGICPYGCDTPHIAQAALLPPAPEKGGKGESDYAPYCQYCGANEKQFCKCGPISKNH